MRNKIALTVIIITAILGLTACNSFLDVIGDRSIASFEQVLDIAKEHTGENMTYGGWSLTSPDEEASFVWSWDFTRSQPYDVLLVVNAQPFLDAGLDVSKLPAGMLEGDKIIVGTELSNYSTADEVDLTPIASYELIVRKHREVIKYHSAMDHFGVDLRNGNMFEWAKDMSKNDKDIVFVLDPQPFLAAGVDPERVKGWVFAKVETMDEKMKMVEVEKFLKPFELDGK